MHRHLPFRRFLARTLILLNIFIPSGVFISRLPAHADEIPPTIFIEEVAWSGSSASIADEWIELANGGPATTTIGGWSLRGAATQPIFLPLDAEIPPGGTYRIANYAETDEKSALAVNVQLTTTTIALSNSTFAIELFDANALSVDRAGDGQSPPAGSSSPHATMIRSATSSGDLAASWMSATSSVGFKNAISDVGAPGTCAICFLGDAPPSDPIAPSDPTETTPSETIATSTQPVPVTPTPPVITTFPPASSPPSAPPPPLHISLNEAMSNPAAGPEWVELKISEINATATDRALELWDKSSRFITIPARTPLTSPGYLILTLTSARLNNGGDDLSLRDPSGATLELTVIPALEDGVAWAKADSGAWKETELLTPGNANQFSEPRIVQTPPASQTTHIVAPSVSTTVTSAHQTTSTAATPLGPPLTILLNEAMSNPDGGKEWVELRIAETEAAIVDRAYELWDGSGRVATIPGGTPVTAPGYLLVTLTTARLNNGGDALSLREPGGDITLDAIDVPSLAKGISWARDETDEWTDTDHPTPGAPNVATMSEGAQSSGNTEGENEPSSGTSTTKTNAKTDSLTEYENDMPKESVVGARVRLVGTVGSVPRLLGATHAFILLGEDGRAAIVYLPKHLNTPIFGSTVRAMGTLTATERQLELRMKTSDVWMTIATSTPPQPRAVDFLAPGTEDAWSLVAASGTVKTVGTTSFVMDVDSVDVTVSVPAAAGYRTQRLTPGDAVRIIGILDPRKETATVIVRTPDDIELTAHAPDTVKPVDVSSDGKKPGGLPDWTPFGAAAGAVAATGGLQRVRAILKRRKLEAMAASAS